MNAREFLQTDVVVLGILTYALLGKVADSATRLLERHWLHSHGTWRTDPLSLQHLLLRAC